MPTSLVEQRFAQQGATVFHPISTATKTQWLACVPSSNPTKEACGELRRTRLSMPSWSTSLFLKA
jgi:hypothetical protein